MKKYDALGAFLKAQHAARISMTFAEIERVIGDKLPGSAYRHRPWWSNNPGNNVMTKVWLDAGFLSEQVDMEGRRLVFTLMEEPRASGGMAEDAPEFRAADAEGGEKKPRRSPLFGCMRGTFRVDPAWDVTKPALEPEEWKDWEASLDRKADLWFRPRR